MEKELRIIISGGGTGGHIYPALSIINKIKQRDKNAEILYVGTTNRMEKDIIPKYNIPYYAIKVTGLERKLSINNLKTLKNFIFAVIKMKKKIKEFKPDIVIGTGGYICGATISSAHNLKIPTLLHESNAFPGMAIKMLANKTNTILVSFRDAIPRIKNCKNVVFTGTPVKIKKKDFNENERNKIIQTTGLNNKKPIILVFGGSQGAKRINDTLVEIIKTKLNKDYQVIWATGPKQYDIIKEELEMSNININNIENMKILPYIYNMEELMNVVDVIIARSGAMTITEISNLGKPAILVPLPNVSHDHQLYNAKALEKVGAAKIILDNEINGKILNKTVEEIILDKQKMKEMGKNALKISTRDAEDKIYKEIKKLVK